PTQRRNNRGTQNRHPLDVGTLPFHVDLAHVHYALHAHQRAYCGCLDAMLTRAGFSNDLLLPKPAREQDLTDRVVHLMCAGVAEVFALKVNLCAYCLRKSSGVIQWRGSSYIVLQKRSEFFLKFRVIPDVEV